MLESLDQCASVQNGVLLLEVMECVRKICEKLHIWSQGREIDNICGEINKRYPTLESCDYQGPNTYTNREDIPEELKFVIQETFSENFDSSSVATSDSINQIEVSYDTSEDSDDSDEESPRSHGVDQDSEQKDSGNWSDKVPKSLHSPNGITTDSDIKMIELEKSTAVKYYKLLKNRMFRLNSIRSAVEIDQKIQEFSSQFCQGNFVPKILSTLHLKLCRLFITITQSERQIRRNNHECRWNLSNNIQSGSSEREAQERRSLCSW